MGDAIKPVSGVSVEEGYVRLRMSEDKPPGATWVLSGGGVAQRCRGKGNAAEPIQYEHDHGPRSVNVLSR